MAASFKIVTSAAAVTLHQSPKVLWASSWCRFLSYRPSLDGIAPNETIVSNPDHRVNQKVSFIIPTKNSGVTLKLLLESIRAQSHHDTEIVVVDNWSSDNTVEIAQRYADTVQMGGPERSGQRNQGAALSTGSVLVFLDSDMVLGDGVAQEAMARCGPNGDKDFAVIPERSIGHGFWGKCRELEKKLYVGDHTVEAARVFRRQVFDRLGGYETQLTGPEDWDLPDRASRSGYALGRLESVVVHDEGRPTVRWIFAKKRYYGRSLSLYLRRHRGAGARRVLRLSLFRQPALLAQQPALAIGLLALKMIDGIALAIGMIEGSIRSRSDEVRRKDPLSIPDRPEVEVEPPRRRTIWRRYGDAMFSAATEDNIQQIGLYCGSLKTQEKSRILDLGCWDGTAFVRYAPRGELYGLDTGLKAVRLATSKGIKTVVADLERRLPYRDGSFDVVVSNQVIEHLSDTDCFVRECLRLLRPGGHIAISTENLASWHNIVALFLGWQAFSLTNVSSIRAGIGNPLANLRADATGLQETGWQHRRVFSHRGLIELFRAHGFVDVGVRAAGYYPLPTKTARLDPRHAAFLTVVGRRPE